MSQWHSIQAIINTIKLIQTLIKIQSIMKHYIYIHGIFDAPSQMWKGFLFHLLLPWLLQLPVASHSGITAAHSWVCKKRCHGWGWHRRVLAVTHPCNTTFLDSWDTLWILWTPFRACWCKLFAHLSGRQWFHSCLMKSLLCAGCWADSWGR